MNYNERVYLLYSGVHYDALALAPTHLDPDREEFDQTIFSAADLSIQTQAQELAEQERKVIQTVA